MKDYKDLVNNRCEWFDSLTHFVREVESRPLHDGWRTRSSRREGDKDWAGTGTFEEAVALLDTGDEEGYQEMLKFFEKLTGVESTGNGNKPTVRNYFTGGSPNVVRAMMGLPRDMRQIHREPCKSKTVEFLYDNTAMCGVSRETMCERGAKMLAIVHMLESNGYSVKVSVVTTLRDSNRECFEDGGELGWVVPVKDYRDYVDMKKLAYPLTNSAFFRRLGFAYIETCPMYDKKGYMPGYGRRSEDMPLAFREYAADVRSRGGNMFYLDAYGMDDVKPVQWLKDNGFVR